MTQTPLLPWRNATSLFGSAAGDAPADDSAFSSAAVVATLEQQTSELLSDVDRHELACLVQESSPEQFFESLLAFGVRQEQSEDIELAARVYSAIITTVRAQHGMPSEQLLQQRAQERLDAITGQGAGGARIEFLARRFAFEVSEPSTLFAMGAAGIAFRMTRLMTLSRLAMTPEANFLTRGWGARALASMTGFGVEGAMFPLAGRLANATLGRPQDWNGTALFRDLASSYLVLGGMRFAGLGANALLGKVSGLAGVAPGFLPLQFAVQQTGMLSGILLGHRLEEAFGLRVSHAGATTLVDSLAMLLQFHVAGRLSQGAFGERFRSWEQHLDLQTEILARQRPRPNRLSILSGLRNWAEGNRQAQLAYATTEAGNTEEPATAPSATPSTVFMMQGNGASADSGRPTPDSSSPPRRIDPQQTLAVLPVGTVTPHGNERTTYQRAIGDPEWYAEVGVMNGHLEYRGEGNYVDKQSGEVLSLEQVVERYGAQIRGETGFRSLASDLPIETDWAGQLPTGLRGPEGETENHLLQLMGLSKSQIKGLKFGGSTSYLHGSDQFALQGLYALYRSAVQWGMPLDEIVGHDPRRMGLSLGAGLGGMNNLVDLITAATRRRLREGQATMSTDPATGPLVLPALLIDSMQGLFTAVLGPKGGTLPPGLTPETVIRTVGRIPVDVGACATGYKAFADAADMFRPTWPGQMPTELAFFGSSEASHGRASARTTATGFNAMKAMETRERLNKRGGRIEDGYAPLTTDVLGFWPSEGAGVGAMMRLARALELGLPVDATVAGYSITGDQGGKNHPAGLGLGGVSSLLESLNMARDWQGLDPRDLQYMNLHGTGTPDNNKVEPSNLLAVLDAFGYQGPLRLSAYKALLGHGLGAAGSMEIGLLMMALRHQLAPGAFNLQGRQLDPNVLALGGRVVVSPDSMSGPLRFVGGQSQGFAGNNGSALFRYLDDQSLHETYGYSMPEIAAYRSRVTERQGLAQEWEEGIRTGRKTVGEFLSWFGLSEAPPPKPMIIVLPGETPEPEEMGSSSVPPGSAELMRMIHEFRHRPHPVSGGSGEIPAVLDPLQASSDFEAVPEMVTELGAGAHQLAPAFLQGIRVRPEQMIVSVGRGSLLTTRGTTRATRHAAMLGVDHPHTLAHLAEDFGVVRYAGRDAGGQDLWQRADTGQAITPGEIASEFGDSLLRDSGIREIPLQGEAQGLPVRHGGLLPEPLRGGQRLLQLMGLDAAGLNGSDLKNQRRNLEYASDVGVYGLYVALGAQVALGRPLHELFEPSRFGASQGTAFPGLDRFLEIADDARRGKDSLTYRLQSGLPENARGLYLNLVLPHFDFSELRQNPQALERILPRELAAGQMPRTGGVNLACSAACASGLYALFGARNASLRIGLDGEYPMDAMMVLGADATFSPFDSAPIVAGFSRKAPMTVENMVRKLEAQGRIPPELAQGLAEQRLSYAQVWEVLPQDLRRLAMNESSAPFSRHAKGLVVAEGAAALPWLNFQRAIELGIWPSSRLLGIHVNSGEGGASNLASMDQGVVTSTLVALNQAKAHAGAVPQVWQAHGTSTELNNIAEVMSIYQAFRYAGLSHPMSVSAIKGLVGHTMGAASAIDMVMGVQSLLDGSAPGLFNMRTQDLDPRYAERTPEALAQFQFSTEPAHGGIENVLITSEGFLSSDAAAILGHFPQDPQGAVEMLRDYGVPEHQRAEWRARAEDNRARAENWEEQLRRGRLNFRELLAAMRF